MSCCTQNPYRRSAGNALIGVVHSFHPIVANNSVDLLVCVSATQLPLRDQSVDVVLAVYSFHQMIGPSRQKTQNTVMSVLQEFSLVVRPGGNIFVIEIAPIEPFGIFRNLFWELSKRVLGSALV